ncbi:MAG: SHOCT-like domain-containing protein [Paraclostridium sordellii]
MEDKKRVLKMIEEGKISAEEGLKLLEALESNPGDKVKVNKQPIVDENEFFKIDKNSSKEKMIYIRVISSDGERVKVNIPIGFFKVLGSNSLMGSSNLDKYNIDINSIIDAVENGFEGRLVEVNSDDGDRVIIEIG